MTFLTQDKSLYHAQPVYFFKFERGAEEYHYDNTVVALTMDSDVYDPEAVAHEDKINITGKMERATITVRLPASADAVLDYLTTYKTTPMWLSIYRWHKGIALTSETRLQWKGRVIKSEFKNSWCFLECASLQTAMQMPLLQAQTQTLCNWTLYDADPDEVKRPGGCPVVKADFAEAQVVTAIDGEVVTLTDLSAFSADWFRGGYAEAPNSEPRDIVGDRDGNDIRLLVGYSTNVLDVGDTLTLYAGCDHLFATCQSAKFNAYTINGETFGGFPYRPTKNPFRTGIA